MALDTYRRGGYAGVGYALHLDEGIVGIDLDKARDPASGEIAPWALPILQRLPTYGEASPSATGLRSIGRGHLSKGTAKPYATGKGELYSCGRYLTFTGHCLPDCPEHLNDLGSNVDWLVRLIDPPPRTQSPLRHPAKGFP